MPHLARRAERFRTADAATIFSSARPSTRQAKTPRRDSQGRQAKRAPLAKEACGPPRRKAACRRSLRQKARLRKREPSQRGNVNRRRVQGQPPPPGTQPKHVNETLKNAKGRGARKNPCKASCRHRLLALLSRASPFPFSRPRPALASACARTRSDIARNAVAHERSRGASCKTRAGRSAFAGGIGVFG